jgi:hypothetical protein
MWIHTDTIILIILASLGLFMLIMTVIERNQMLAAQKTATPATTEELVRIRALNKAFKK